jgi:predicted ATPase
MLKRLRFKNWRSLRDVEVPDLQPLTVFIGPNSSGKTNILDGLYFLRRMLREGSPGSVYFQANRERIRTLGAGEDEPITLEFSFQPSRDDTTLRYSLTIRPEGSAVHFDEHLVNEDGTLDITLTGGRGTVTQSNADGSVKELVEVYREFGETRLRIPLGTVTSLGMDDEGFKQTIQFVAQRWQLLGENFMPVRSLPIDEEGDVFLIDRSARNTILMLDYMQQNDPRAYDHLQDDLRWLLGYVERVGVDHGPRDTRLFIKETMHAGHDAPTISAGTARLVAILTAYYALMETKEYKLPGLIAIEEPDMAVHPLLLRRFVELLRTYVEGEHPRQFILTTHNPRLLDLFEPEEVRIVQRDGKGETIVRGVPENIRDIWLDEYGLGEVWMTRSLGDAE